MHDSEDRATKAHPNPSIYYRDIRCKMKKELTARQTRICFMSFGIDSVVCTRHVTVFREAVLTILVVQWYKLRDMYDISLLLRALFTLLCV